MTHDSPDPATGLLAARAHFAAGNYSAARRQATALLLSDNHLVTSGARDLLDQMSPAPLGKFVLLLTGLLLVAVTFFAYVH